MQNFRAVWVSLAMVCAFLGRLDCSAANHRPDGLADGAGIWVNMWNYPQSNYEGYCQDLHAKGVRNVFIQCSRSNTEAVCHPEQLGELIDACHRYKIRIIAWSFNELSNPSADADKVIAAARFTSPKGQHMDALACNLEKNLDQTAVEAYSKKIRNAVGPNFPMIAVVYSPLNQAPQVAHIPWKTLDHYYDVIAPMNYWNSKYKKFDAYDYTISTIQAVREKVGRPDVEIHVIGDGMGTHADTINQFFKACQDAEATTASIYPNFKMTPEQMECVSHYSEYFPVNSRFRLAAYHELVKKGSLATPANLDPSTPITRGEFYQLLVKQMYPASAEVTSAGALELLSKAGAGKFIAGGNSENVEDACNSPISSSEAFNLLAKLMDRNGSFGNVGQSIPIGKIAKRPGQAKKLRADRWFLQPAFAAGEAQRSNAGAGSAKGAKPMNYLDAAQLVLEASSGIK
ncbi:MAG TPA: hypothetical protein V6C97_34580 [Oculatellaceae cyanobacterium]